MIEHYADIRIQQATGDAELRRHAEQDILTGIYNRYTIEFYTDRMLEQNTKENLSAVFLIGLDHFKRLNDTYGHVKGDEMLRSTADCLERLLTDQVLLGRIAGDEFIVYQPDCGSMKDVEVTAERICRAVQALEEGEGIVTASIGISLAPTDGTNFADLYYCADDALFQAKHAGKNRWAAYTKQTAKEENPVSREWLLEESSDIVYVCDFYNYDLLYMNQGARDLFGIGSGDYIGQKCYEVLQNKDHPCEFCTNHRLCREEFYHWEYKNEIIGKSFLLRDRIVDWYGVPARIEFATDVSTIDKRNQHLQEQVRIDQAIISCLRILNSTQTLEAAISSMLEMLCRFYEADRAFIVEYQQQTNTLWVRNEWKKDGLKGAVLLTGTDEIHPEEALKDCFENHENYRFDHENYESKVSSEYRYILYDAGVTCQRGVPFYLNGEPVGLLGVDNPASFREEMTVLETLSYFISEELARNKLSDTLTYLSYHDSLTGLWNRNKYAEYLKEFSNREVQTLGIAVADINALKDINKFRGHAEGDVVVNRAARMLSDCFPGAYIFRLSGDEFVVHSEDTIQSVFMEQVTASLGSGDRLDGYGISIGYAWTDQEPDYSRLTMQATDIMMIQKREFYQKQSEQGSTGTYDIMQQKKLMEYIKNGNFHMYLQPKADCQSLQLNGAEALVRFYSPEFGIVPPGQFIPRLEREHSIQYVDLYIFEEVCRMLARWQEEGRKLFPVSLNFSRQTVLDPNILTIILNITEKYQVPKEYIEVEITESLGDYESRTIAAISGQIKKAGFQLALDDFGSHYTNMAMLANVPVDVLKLDQGMIRGVMESISNQLVLKSILSLCRDLGILAIAEGVETQEQLELLQSLRCDSIQGYLFGKPMPVETFEKDYM